VTFKDLQKVIESQPDYSSSQRSDMLQRLAGKAFYSWDYNNHYGNSTHYGNARHSSKKDCCFTHMIGLPTKDGIEKPLFDYQREIYFALVKPGYLNSNPSNNQSNIPADNVLFPFKVKHLWIKKATGLGVTEFMLRFMAWLCVYNDDYRNSQMVILTGPNIENLITVRKKS
jgi:hypothetical protein